MEFSKHSILKETAKIGLGMSICVACMIGVYALIGKYDLSVLLGAIVGGALAMGYYVSMVICADIAAKKALQQDVKGGEALMRVAHIVRMVVLFGAWVLCALTKRFDLIALVLPVVFVRPIMGVVDQLSRKGGGAQ